MSEEAEKKARNQMNSVFRRISIFLGMGVSKILGEGDFVFSATVVLQGTTPDSPVQSISFASRELLSVGANYRGTAYGKPLLEPPLRKELSWARFPPKTRLTPHPNYIPYHLRIHGYQPHPEILATQAESIRAIPFPENSSVASSPVAGRACLLKITRFDYVRKDSVLGWAPWTQKDGSGRKDHYCYLIIIEGKTLSPLEMLLQGTKP